MLRIAVGLHRDSADDWDSAAIWAQEVEKLGIDSTARASFGLYNTKNDIDRLRE